LDLLVLLAQFMLIMLVIIVPLIGAYDKWKEWSPSRKLIALSLGAATAAVIFGHYRRLVSLDRGDLPDVLSQPDKKWYVRKIVVEPWEYSASLLAGSILIGLGIGALQKRKYGAAMGYFAAFALMLTVSLMVKFKVAKH
jgi:hypothetical protein